MLLLQVITYGYDLSENNERVVLQFFVAYWYSFYNITILANLIFTAL